MTCALYVVFAITDSGKFWSTNKYFGDSDVFTNLSSHKTSPIFGYKVGAYAILCSKSSSVVLTLDFGLCLNKASAIFPACCNLSGSSLLSQQYAFAFIAFVNLK